MVSRVVTSRLPSLPHEIWTNILSYLQTPHHITTVAQVSTAWYAHTTSPLFQLVWRRIWDSTASLHSTILLNSPFLRVPGSWRHQVAASYRLEHLHSAPIFYLPPRYDIYGDVLPEDRLNVSPSTHDLEDVLGRAVYAHAFAQLVLIAFERGLGLLRQTSPHTPYKTSSQLPYLYYDHSSHLQGIQILTPASPQSGIVLAVTHNTLLRIDLQLHPHPPFVYRTLDTFHDIGTAVQLTVSTDSRYAAIGFCTGAVRLVSLSGGCRFSFQLPEQAEHLAVSEKWAIASNSFQPIAVSVWDLSARSLHASFTQVSQEWANVLVVAALAPTSKQDQFIIWDGRNIIRFFNAHTTTFVRTINVLSNFKRQLRTATEEAEHGAGAPNIGRGKMVLSADRQTAALATSNRVMVISLRASKVYGGVPQLDHAKRALVAMSTDDRIVITAESNAYGNLRSRVSGRVAIAATPKLQVWNVQREALRCELDLPSPATALSVCGDTVAAVCGAVGQVMVAFANL